MTRDHLFMRGAAGFTAEGILLYGQVGNEQHVTIANKSLLDVLAECFGTGANVNAGRCRVTIERLDD